MGAIRTHRGKRRENGEVMDDDRPMKIMIGDEELLWHFKCRATKLPDGRYRIRATGMITGREIERIGHNPLHELIRLFGDLQADEAAQGGKAKGVQNGPTRGADRA